MTFRASGSLNVIAVLLGILMNISGIFHRSRVIERAEVAPGMAGYRWALVRRHRRGAVRHLRRSEALIGLIVGLTGII